ncbi:MAG: type II CAAX endopeptidase family protein [Candidatus Eisenbacteria bacterium]
MESPDYGRDEPLSAPEAVAAALDAPTLAARTRGPIFGPYVSVLLYLVGYFVVGIVVSLMLAMALGLLVGFGLVEMPPIEQELASIAPMDIEAILQVMEPYLLHLVVASGLYTILFTWAFVRIIDRRRLRDLGLKLRRGWFGNFAKGAALAVLILGVIFAFSLAVGSIRVEGFARAAPEGVSVAVYFLGALLAFLSVGVYEELMFRGYVLQRLNERAGKVASVLVSSFIFAVMHGFNPGADAFGIFNTIGIGVILCVLYFRTGSLWMAIGFHTAWNFSLGYLYSMPVSGIPLYGVLDVVEVEASSRLTGGSYGPEAGLACTAALAVWGAWLIWKKTGRRPTEG